MESNPNFNIDISGIVAFVVLMILIILTNLLTSCVDVEEIEPPKVYTYTIEKDCESCNIYFWIEEDNITLLNYKVPYRAFTGEAITGDALNIRVINIASGANNNILFEVNGMLTIQNQHFFHEIDLGGANYRQIQYTFE